MARTSYAYASKSRHPVAKRDSRRRRLLSTRRATRPAAQIFHGYDIRGNLASLGELTGTKSFSYCAIERLTGVTQATPAPAPQVESYTYDLEGNRTASHITSSYVTDDANHVLDDGTNTYSWSPNGALLSRTPKANTAGAVSFSHEWYGAFNQTRLIGLGGAFPMAFAYDGLNRNVIRDFGFDPAQGRTVRHYDGPDVVLSLRNYYGGGASQWTRFVQGPGYDQVLATEVYAPGQPPTPGTGTQYYYHADGEGSIRLLTDSTGQIANRYDYDSYGRRQSVVESVAQPYGWKGREFIAGPDIVENRARFYDPVLGRFLEEDPLGYGGGDTNYYSFVWNNPKRWNDFVGLSAVEYSGNYAIASQTAGSLVDLGAAIGCAFSTIGSALEFANAPDVPTGARFVVNAAVCAAGWVGGSIAQAPKTRISDIVDNAACLLSSFSGGTQVETREGLKSIESIIVGDEVVALDAYTGQLVYRPVFSLMRRLAPIIYHVAVQRDNKFEEVLNVTSEHKLFVKDRGWTAARDISEGDLIISKDAIPLRVTRNDHENLATFVYNLEIAQDHSYFVGTLGALAHNTHGNCKSSTAVTYLYALKDRWGNFLKWGITADLAGRYTQEELKSMGGAYLEPIATGSRQAMLAAERYLVERWPG